MLAPRDFGWLVHTRTGRLVSTFCLFILVQLIFASVYYLLYKRRRDYFAFNADILRTQSTTFKHELAKLREAIAALREAIEELQVGIEPIVEGRTGASMELRSGRKCVMVFLSGPPAGGPHGSLLEIFDASGDLLLRADPTEISFRGWLNSAAWIETRAEWQEAIPRILKKLESKEQRDARRLETLRTATPDVWTYWDFLYFSTIVQTTVGFGDILPNNTLIRMLVVIHILIGYALLIVVLNVVLGS
jgi:ion channel/uncharacterized protein DUF1345